MSDDAKDTEIEALRRHNSELLADLKTLKREAKDLAGQLETVAAERDQAQAMARKVTLETPVAEMAARVAVDSELFLSLFDRHYTFEHDGERVVIRDKDGKPAMIQAATVSTQGKERTATKGEPREATFTEADIRALCDQADKGRFDHLIIATHASGGGAIGSRSAPPSSNPTPTPTKPARQFGLV